MPLLDKFRVKWRNPIELLIEEQKDFQTLLKIISDGVIDNGKTLNLIYNKLDSFGNNRLLLQTIADNTSCACSSLGDLKNILIEIRDKIGDNPQPSDKFVFESPNTLVQNSKTSTLDTRNIFSLTVNSSKNGIYQGFTLVDNPYFEAAPYNEGFFAFKLKDGAKYPETFNLRLVQSESNRELIVNWVLDMTPVYSRFLLRLDSDQNYITVGTGGLSVDGAQREPLYFKLIYNYQSFVDGGVENKDWWAIDLSKLEGKDFVYGGTNLLTAFLLPKDNPTSVKDNLSFSQAANGWYVMNLMKVFTGVIDFFTLKANSFPIDYLTAFSDYGGFDLNFVFQGNALLDSFDKSILLSEGDTVTLKLLPNGGDRYDLDIDFDLFIDHREYDIPAKGSDFFKITNIDRSGYQLVLTLYFSDVNDVLGHNTVNYLYLKDKRNLRAWVYRFETQY